MKRLITKISLLLGIAALSVSGGLLMKSSPLLKANAATLAHEGDLYGGAHISFRTSSSDDVPAKILFDINGEGGDSFEGTGLYLRMKNYTGVDTYINMYLRSLNGARRGPRQDVRQTYFNLSGTEVTYGSIPLRDFNNYLILPANFDGYIYMNYNDQMTKAEGSNDKTFNYIAVTMYMELSAKYDTFANFVIGDIYTNSTQIFDGSAVSDENFNKTFTENGTDYLFLDRMSKDDNHEPKGDLLGSIKVNSTNSGSGFYILADGMSIANDGVYVRVRNNQAAANYVITHFNSRNNGRVTNTPGANYYLYDNEGKNRTAHQFDNVDGGRLAIPASFDGFIFLPVASYTHNTGYSALPFDPTDIYATYFEGVMNDIDFGDMTTRIYRIYDGSEYYPEDLSLHVGVFGSCTYTLNEGHLIPVVPPFDYGDVNYIADLQQAGHITCNPDTQNTIATARINLPTVSDFSSGIAITVRMKGLSGDFAYFFNIVDENGNVSEMPDNSSDKKVKFVDLDGTVRTAASGGNNHAIKYPMNFDGNLVIPVELLSNKTASAANLARVARFEIGIAVFETYDAGFNAAFGDIGYIVEDTKTQVIVLDTSECNFNEVFTKGDYPQFINISKYYPPAACPWIGDVKLLNPLKYDTDTQLRQEVVWNSGDNACTYNVMDDGMFVHIGPYETGHTYGSYMALQIDERGVFTDRMVWSREVEGQKELALGITAYVKNLSRKEIGITIQFDEKTGVWHEPDTQDPGHYEYMERWCLKGYPAMYYAWDVNTNAEYSFYCKSDQFQIPVGFEGYVRIPFASYRVPDWCQSTPGVDNVLDIEKWSGKFYLTSDNTRFEDLEFFIKNIGIYFNKTTSGSLFDNSHSIKTNMGL